MMCMTKFNFDVCVRVSVVSLGLLLPPTDTTDDRKEKIYHNKWDTIYGEIQGGRFHLWAGKGR